MTGSLISRRGLSMRFPPVRNIRVADMRMGCFIAGALRVDGTVTCWGHSRLAIRRADPPAFVAVSIAADSYVCGLRLNGAINCWGDSRVSDPQKTPTGPFTEIATAVDFSCGLRGDETVLCWGRNYSDDAYINFKPYQDLDPVPPPSFVQWG